MKYNKHTRRMFLQGAGKTLAIPLLSSLMPRELWAQGTTAIKRAIFVCSPYDYGRHQNWFPTMDQPGQQLVPSNGDRTLRYAPLSSYLTSSTANLSRVFGNRLNPYVGSMNLIRGLDLSTRIAHGRGHTLGNTCAVDPHDTEAQRLTPIRTIDQVLRNNSRFNPINRDVVVLGSSSRSYRSSNGSISLASLTASNPRGAFNYLFDNGNLPETGGGTSTPHPRRDLLSSVMEDYTRVMNGRQISSADRVALTNATDLIADIQRNLAGTVATGGCRYKTINPGNFGTTYYPTASELKAYADIIVAAIMCDVSRIFNFYTYVNEDRFDVNPNDDFHQGHSHIPFTTINGRVNWEYMGDVQNSFVTDFLQPLLAGLSAVDPSNSQSYLYNSLVHYQIECSQVHGLNSQPCMLAGNAGGSLPSGYLLDYTDRTRPHSWVADGYSTNSSDSRFSHEYVGIPMNRAWNTILQSLGLTPADYENSGINGHFQNRSDGRYGSTNNGIANLGGYGWWGPSASSYGNGYITRQALYNLHHFKNPLPLPTRSA